MSRQRLHASLPRLVLGFDIHHLGRILGAALICMLALAGTRVFAAPADQVEVSMRSFQVVQRAGKTSLQAALQARPGDLIEYQVTYRNAGATAAREVGATLPVPAGAMVYLAGSATPQQVEASLDGKTFSPAPLVREVVRNGRRQSEAVPPAEYRFLRWNLGEIPAGQAVTVSARMLVAPAQ